MAEQAGRDFLLKVEDSNSPASYTTIAGMTLTGMTINNNPVDVTSKDDAGIQVLLGDAGVQEMVVSADGRYDHAAVHDTLEDAAHNRTKLNYQITWGNGDNYQAAFEVESYSRSGPHDGEETFSVSLRRNGSGLLTRA